MERSYGFPSNYFQNKYLLIAHLRDFYYKFDATYDPVVRKSKGMQKSPEFDAKYGPIVTKSKSMQKVQNLTQNMTL